MSGKDHRAVKDVTDPAVWVEIQPPDMQRNGNPVWTQTERNVAGFGDLAAGQSHVSEESSEAEGLPVDGLQGCAKSVRGVSQVEPVTLVAGACQT